MKILIIGDANHQFVYNFARDLKSCEQNILIIDILSTSKDSIKSEAQVYDKIFSPLVKSKLVNIKGLRILIRKYLLKKEIKKITETYDICNIHYADKDILPLVNKLNKISRKIVCAIWGSDLYRVSNRLLKKQKKYYDLIDIVAFENKNTLKHFDDIFHLDTNKYRSFTFHLKPLELLKSMRNVSKESSKKLLNIDPSKVTITIGYSASPGSQHLRIIETLCKSTKLSSINNEFCLLLPLTYPKNKVYTDRIKSALDSSNFSYKLFTNFLTDEEVAHLRKATDIFLILTVTDQLSGSLLEHLYTQGIVLAGDWLPYSVLEEKGVYFKKISASLDNLCETLFNTILNFDSEQKKCIINPDVIAGMNNKEVIIENWYNIFEEVLN